MWKVENASTCQKDPPAPIHLQLPLLQVLPLLEVTSAVCTQRSIQMWTRRMKLSDFISSITTWIQKAKEMWYCSWRIGEMPTKIKTLLKLLSVRHGNNNHGDRSDRKEKNKTKQKDQENILIKEKEEWMSDIIGTVIYNIYSPLYGSKVYKSRRYFN
uniref:Uncharacterized protein n=1 Tax=Cacopsylla melanoneura TaxID=428564 RepID=A0A8D8UX63_9HEMI